MGYKNHLSSTQSQRQVAAIASGLHAVDGTLFLSEVSGTPSRLYVRQVLGLGEWEGITSVYFERENVPDADWEFFAGAANNETNTFFTRDAKHPGFTLLNVKAPAGFESAAPDERKQAVAFCKCEKFPDFDNAGNQIDASGNIITLINAELNSSAFFYTVKPANVLIGWLLKYAKKTYDRYSFNWQKFTEWRDFCATLETRDYRIIPNLEGIGLTANFYSDTTFTTLISSAARHEPYLNFESAAGAPANGISPTAFSARYEGFVKPEFTETYAFTLAASDTGKLWIDGALVIDTGATTGTKALNAGQFHAIKVDWTNSAGNSELILKWQSASRPLQVIPQKHFYPRVEQRPRYEAHVAFSSPTSADAMIATILSICNSTRQSVEGKEVFECIEQKQISFNFTDAHILKDEKTGKLKCSWYRLRDDPRSDDPFDIYEITCNDIDSRYLNPPTNPVRSIINPGNPNPLVNTIVLSDGQTVSINMSQWQMWKLLKHKVNREVEKDLVIDGIEAIRATYPVQAADIIRVSLTEAGIENKPFLVIESEDESPEDTAEERKFKYQEWIEPEDFGAMMELAG